MDRRRNRRMVIVLRPGEAVRFRCNGRTIIVRARRERRRRRTNR